MISCCKLRTVRIRSSQYIPGKFDHSKLHAKAQSEVWDIVLACKFYGKDFSFSPTHTETPGDKYAIIFTEHINVKICFLKFFSIKPICLYTAAAFYTCMF